jgi:hypothetical protein
MYATIQPVPAFGGPATILVIDNVSVLPASAAGLWWHLRATPDGADLVPTAPLTLTGDAYAAWGSNDEYLYTYTAQQLGLTIVEIVPDAPAIIAPPLPDMSVPPMADAVDAPAAPVAPSDEAAPAVDGGTNE